LINQARANAGLSALSAFNAKLYPLIGTANFRDITSGSNNVNSTNSGGKYNAGIGYDQVTGIGVPIMQPLTQNLVGTTTLIGVQVQPTAQSVQPGGSASITASASGSPTGYQWQRMPIGTSTWSNVSNGGSYSGATAAALTVNPVASSMNGDQFQCIVQYASSSVTSSPKAILTVETPLIISTLAGTAKTTGSPSTSYFNYPSGVALDTSGDLYIADFSNNCIRKVTPSGTITTAFGSTSGSSGSTNGSGTSSLFYEPNAIASDGNNNFYVADTGNNSIRKIVLSTGQVTTLASSGFSSPEGVAADGSGNVYVADTNNHVIKKITSSGTVSILAGLSGTAGYVNGTGTSAEFNTPTSVATDSSGNVYVADSGNSVIRKCTSAGVVTTYAGQAGVAGYADGPSSSALFNSPFGVATDNSGNVYVADCTIPTSSTTTNFGTFPPTTTTTYSTVSGNNLLRRIASSGAVSTLAGQVGVSGTTDGAGTAAQFYSPQAIAVSSGGVYYVADTFNQTIREGGIVPIILTSPIGQIVTVGQSATFSVTASGSGPFSYQWLKGGSKISGASNSTYTLSSVAVGDAGNYSVTVTNAFGSVTSSTATLIPVTSQPVAQTASSGQSVTFSVSVAGTGSFNYQWLFNGVTIAGATASSYTISNVSSSNAGAYSVMVSDSYGVVTTNAVNLVVNAGSIADTPAMPAWAIVILATGMIVVASRQKELAGSVPR
jgi:hypothetical protein